MPLLQKRDTYAAEILVNGTTHEALILVRDDDRFQRRGKISFWEDGEIFFRDASEEVITLV